MKRRDWLFIAGVAVPAAATGVLLWRWWAPLPPPPVPPPPAGDPEPTPEHLAVADELGYRVEYEFDPATLHTAQSNPDRNGQEYVGVVVQGHYSVMILDGALTVNREPRGAVAKGDRVRVTRDRRVWVNGDERR